MSSNYPAGVTAMDSHISGPDEAVIDKHCPSTSFAVTPAVGVKEELRRLAGLANYAQEQTAHVAVGHLPRIEKRLRDLLEQVEKSEDVVYDDAEVECNWSGPVDVKLYDGTEHWTCPMCGTENEEPYLDDRP